MYIYIYIYISIYIYILQIVLFLKKYFRYHNHSKTHKPMEYGVPYKTVGNFYSTKYSWPP